MLRLSPRKKQTIYHVAKSSYWFLIGFILASMVLSSLILFYFQHTFKNRVIPGIFIDNVYIGEKSRADIEKIFLAKNQKIGENTFIFSQDSYVATVSAKKLDIGYDINLITEQALSLGKTKNLNPI